MIELLHDEMFMRGIERLIIVLVHFFMVYLGYKLFIKGIDQGESSLTAETHLYRIVFSGKGPDFFS